MFNKDYDKKIYMMDVVWCFIAILIYSVAISYMPN